MSADVPEMVSSEDRGAPRAAAREAFAALAVAAIVIGGSLPALLKVKDLLDYRVHVGWAMTLDRSHLLQTPHFLFQALTLAVKRAFMLRSYMTAGVAVALAADAMTGVIAFLALRRAGSGRPLAAAAAASLPFLGQIQLFLPFDGLYTWGYLAPNVAHNANYTLLRPLALLSFLHAERAFLPEVPLRHATALAALTVITTTLAKPSHAIVLLPAAALFAAWSHGRGRRVQWRHLALGVLAPLTLVLSWQWFITYGPGGAAFGGAFGGTASVIVAPLAVLSEYSGWLAPKLLLSVVLPLAVLLLVPAARRDAPLALAWCCFAAGAAYAYLLGESGERLLQGNFLWSGYIALFVLFFASLRALCRALGGVPVRAWVREPRLALCLAAFGLHLLGGIVLAHALATGRTRL